MNKKTINKIREYYGIPHKVRDEIIESNYRGSTGHFVAVVDDLKEAVKSAFIKDFNRIFKQGKK